MTKSFINLTILILSSQAAAFTTTRVVKRVDNCLRYKQRPDDGSYSYQEINGTIVYNDFEIRESEYLGAKNTCAPRASVEPDMKPFNKFVSPIQMIKLIPKVKPVTNSSVFFVAPVIEKPEQVIVDQSPQSPQNGVKPKRSPRPKWGKTAFQSINYLESLSSSSTTQEDLDNKSLYSSLRNQQGLIREDKLRTTKEAMYEATRRTNPQEAVRNRLAKAEELRKKKEIEKLEKMYNDKQKRLENKRRLERHTKERKRIKDDVVMKRNNANVRNNVDSQIKAGIPILTPFLKKSQSTPLLIGSIISLRYEQMTPYQIKTLEVAQSLHEEHCRKIMENGSSAGKEGGIEAAPIVAIIDHYTGQLDMSRFGKEKRFATLASFEIIENKDGNPTVVNLMCVGRVLLHNYFSSKDAGLTKEEKELNKLLETIHYLSDYEEYEHHDDDDNKDQDEVLPIVMAEFDLYLDDLSILSRASKHQDVSNQRASSMHGVAELYKTANKVYRLHEERKKLLSGLRAGQIRLNTRGMSENEVIEYDDWSDTAESTQDEMIQDYGFGTYGILSTIPDLTKELMVLLKPYYSSIHREREEYDAELASFVALRTLERCADPAEIAAAIVTPSATERLYMAYGIMLRHRDQLVEHIKKMTDDLTDCGEECTDLW